MVANSTMVRLISRDRLSLVRQRKKSIRYPCPLNVVG